MMTGDNAGSRELLDVGREWQEGPSRRSAQCIRERIDDKCQNLDCMDSTVLKISGCHREFTRSDHRVRVSSNITLLSPRHSALSTQSYCIPSSFYSSQLCPLYEFPR
jgi:hypothetical protein